MPGVITTKSEEHEHRSDERLNTALSEIDFGSLDSNASEREEKGEVIEVADPTKPKEKKDDVPESTGDDVHSIEKQALSKPEKTDKGGEVEKDKPVEAAKPVVDKENEDIDKIQVKPGSNPKAQSDIVFLKEAAKKARGEVKEVRASIGTYEAKVKELETKLAEAAKTPVVQPEEVQKLQDRIKQLEHFEFLADPEHSSFITREYDQKLTGIDEAIYGILKGLGVAEKEAKGENGEDLFTIEGLKKLGGPASIPFERWEKDLLPNVPPLERKRLEAKLLEHADIQSAKKVALQDAPAKQQEYAKQVQEKSAAQEKADNEMAMARIAEVQKTQEWARKREIPADATPEQKAEIEEHNKLYEQAERLMPRLFAPQNAREKVDLAVGFLYGLRTEKLLNKEIERSNALQKQLDEVNGKLGKIKAAGDTRVRGSGAPPKPAHKFGGSLEESFAQNLPD